MESDKWPTGQSYITRAHTADRRMRRAQTRMGGRRASPAMRVGLIMVLWSLFVIILALQP